MPCFWYIIVKLIGCRKSNETLWYNFVELLLFRKNILLLLSFSTDCSKVLKCHTKNDYSTQWCMLVWSAGVCVWLSWTELSFEGRVRNAVLRPNEFRIRLKSHQSELRSHWSKLRSHRLVSGYYCCAHYTTSLYVVRLKSRWSKLIWPPQWGTADWN